ncbi:AGAP000461-PB-like protein [Anopheles sinensis]|uniref:AGAP000461-PB-like protein n=1 Tax=Anopheles sinensis TaxID=74873 RepID=A0A084VJC8_ANOSI|nr:AGAP000461-PB-like protein [Anopheles sinensis]
MEDTPSPLAVCQEHDHKMLSSHQSSSDITLLYKSSQVSGYQSIVRMQLKHIYIPDTLTYACTSTAGRQFGSKFIARTKLVLTAGHQECS